MQGASSESGAGEAECFCRAADAQGSTPALPEGVGGSGDVGALSARAVCGHPGTKKQNRATENYVTHFNLKFYTII